MQGPPRSSDRRPTDRPPSRARGSEHPRDPRGSSSRPSEHRRTEQRHSRPSDGRSSRPSEGGSRRPSSDEQNTRRPPSNHVGDERPNVERRGDPRPQYLPNGPDPRRSAPRSAPSSGEQVSRRRASAERGVAKRRSSSLPVEVREQDHELDCDFPEGGRPMRRQMSAPAGDMIPLIRSSLRVATQFLSLKTKGLTQDLTQHKRVEFAFLEVREYPIVIGDNPSVKEGPPITIDWAHDPSTQFVLDVNTFEHMRGTRRISSQLVLPKEIREKWLLNIGTTQKEIAEAIRQVRREKHFRMVSCNNKSYDPMNESIEKVASGIKKIFSFKKTEYEKSLAVSQMASFSPGQAVSAA